MRNLIFELQQELHRIRLLSVENGKRGSSDTIWGSGSLAKSWSATYENWRNLRAQGGDKFALSLGYGSRPQPEN